MAPTLLRSTLVIKLNPHHLALTVLEVRSDQSLVVAAYKKVSTPPFRDWTHRQLTAHRQTINAFVEQVQLAGQSSPLPVTVVIPAVWHQHCTVKLHHDARRFASPEHTTPPALTRYLQQQQQIQLQHHMLFYMVPLLRTHLSWSGERYVAYFMLQSHLQAVLTLVNLSSLRVQQIVPDLETWSHFFTANHSPIKNYLTLVWTDDCVVIGDYHRGQLQRATVKPTGLQLVLRQLAANSKIPLPQVRMLLRLSNPNFNDQTLAGATSGGLIRHFLELLAPHWATIRTLIASWAPTKPILCISPLTQTLWGQHQIQQQLPHHDLFWGHMQLRPWSFFDWAGTWGALSLHQAFTAQCRYMKLHPQKARLPLLGQHQANWTWQSMLKKHADF